MTDTDTTTKPAITFSLEFVLMLLALTAQGFITVELFDPASVAGKLVSVLGLILTGLGYSVSRAKGAKTTLPTALVVLLVLSLATGCGHAKESLGRVAGDTIDCLTPDAAAAVSAFGPAMSDVLRNATSDDGHVDWTPVRAAAAPLKTSAQRCVLASVIAEALRPSKPRADEPQSSPLQWDPVSLAAGFEALRAEWGGPSFRLEGGTL